MEEVGVWCSKNKNIDIPTQAFSAWRKQDPKVTGFFKKGRLPFINSLP
jgi:hypothetical protein